jgi:CHASE3 domain sensor protein
MTDSGEVIGGLIIVIVLVLFVVIMAHFFNGINELPQSNESRKAIKSVEDSWNSTVPLLFLLCGGGLVTFLLFFSKR